MATLEERAFEPPLTGSLPGSIRRTIASAVKVERASVEDAGFDTADIYDNSPARLPASAWVESHMRPDIR